MRKIMTKTSAVVMAAVMAAGLLAGCGKAKLDGTKTVVTVNGTEISMGVLSLATRYQQASTEALYRYFGYADFWDSVADEATGETMGEQLVSGVLTQVEDMEIYRQKAKDYGIEISADDQKKIDEAAAAFLAANTEETLETLSASEDDVKTYLEMQMVQNRMEKALKDEAPIEISDDEVNQTTFSYITVKLPEETEEGEVTEEAEEDADAEKAEDAEETETEDAAEEEADAEKAEETEEDADTEDADAEKTEDAGDEETSKDVAEGDEAEAEETEEETEEPPEPTEADLQAVLDYMLENPEEDLEEYAQSVNAKLNVYTGHFTTVPPADGDSSNYPQEALDQMRTLKDGEFVSELIKSDTSAYLLRVDTVNDEDATATERTNQENTQKTNYVDETTQTWHDEAEIKVDEKILSLLTVVNSHKFTVVTPEPEEPEETADDAAETVEEAADDAAETVEETADDAAETVEEAADDAAETVEEAADDAAETVEDAAETVSDAADKAEDAAADAAETVEEGAENAAEAVEEAVDEAADTSDN